MIPKNGLFGLQDIVLYTFSEGGRIRHFEVRRYSERPLLIRGYLKGPLEPEPWSERRQAKFTVKEEAECAPSESPHWPHWT